MKTSSPPDPLPSGDFWTTDDLTSTQRFLRPSWDAWAPNEEAWLPQAIEKIRQDGHNLHMISERDIATITDAEFKLAFESAWTTMRIKRNDTRKGPEHAAKKAKAARVSSRKGAVYFILLTSINCTLITLAQ